MESYAVVTPPRTAINQTVLHVLNIVFLVLTLVFNFLVNALPLNGKNTGELSAQYPNLFTPAALTFSIWIVIYAALMFFVGWQLIRLRNAQRAYHRDHAVAAIGLKFVWLCVLNMAWLFCWHYEFLPAGLVVMLITLGLLIRMNQLIFRMLPHTTDNRNYLQIPFGLYLGWISVATVANMAAVLVGTGWDAMGLSEKFWTVLMILVATLLAILAVRNWKNIPYALVVCWALTGIIIKHRMLFGASLTMVILSAGVCLLILFIFSYSNFKRWWGSAVSTDAYPPGSIRY